MIKLLLHHMKRFTFHQRHQDRYQWNSIEAFIKGRFIQLSTLSTKRFQGGRFKLWPNGSGFG